MATLYGKLDRVKQYTLSTGTGTVNLNGAAFGVFQTWANGGAISGDQYPYLIEEGNDSEWGFGIYTSGSPATFSRDIVVGSIIGGTSGTTKMSLGGNATVCCAENKFTVPVVRYDDVILAESSLTHFWKMNEASGATSFADSKGSTALTITSDTAGNIQAGWKGVIADGEASVLFRGIPASKTNGIINIPSGSFPSSGSWSVEMILGWEGVFGGVVSTPFNLDTNSTVTSLNFYMRQDQLSTLNRVWFGVAPSFDNWQPNFAVRVGRSTHLVITCDSAASKLTAYVNGVKHPTQFSGTTYQTAAGGLGTYMPSRDAGLYPYFGRFGKLAAYNTALSEATCLAHADAAGLV